MTKLLLLIGVSCVAQAPETPTSTIEFDNVRVTVYGTPKVSVIKSDTEDIWVVTVRP